MYGILSFLCGVLIAITFFMNGQLAAFSTPVLSSFIAHFIGMIVSGFLLITFVRKKKDTATKVPFVSYSSGIFGAFIVICANKAINTSLGISGTMIMILIGQIVCSLIIDAFGFFGMERKTISSIQLIELLFIISGSFCILFLGK